MATEDDNNPDDLNFDNLVHRFKKNIYHTDKGKIRLHVLHRDFDEIIPQAKDGRLSILDIGAGQGQFALELAKAGNSITLTDASEKMLEQAEQLFSEQEITHSRFIHSPAQQLEQHLEQGKQYDLVICHAVLEWLANPESVLKSMTQYIKPGGYLSLMFYSRTGLIYQNLVHGNFDHIQNNSLAGDGTTLTPTNPQDPAEVYQWLDDLNLRICCRSGVRVFYDGIHRQRRKELDSETIYQLEKEFSRKEPYCSLARYLHVICQA